MSAQSPDRPIETAPPPTPSLVNEKQAFSQEQAQPIDERSSDLRHRDDNAPILPVTAPKQEYELTGQPNAQNARWNMESIKAYLMEEVDTDGATGPLSAFCFMTGYIDAVSFTACFIWCAFQTGNTIQLSLALARLFSGPGQGPEFRIADRQALVSLFSFLGGAFIGRLGDKIGAAKSRGWLAFATLLSAGLTMAAALCAMTANESGLTDSRAHPSWTNARGVLALAFASASMGLQALLGTRIGAHFATTVVLTSIWVQVISDPVLFRFKNIYKQRDYKFLAIFSLFCGGFVGRVLTGTIGPAGTLGIGAGFRVFIAGSWMFVIKAKKKSK